MKKKKVLNLKFIIILAFAISFLLFLLSKNAIAVDFGEPVSGYFVQHGLSTMTAVTLDVPIIPVSNVSNAFVIVHQWSNQRTVAGATTPTYSMVAAYLKNESTITLERGAITQNIYVNWMVVEALNGEFSVQQGRTPFNLNAGVLSINTTIPIPINLSNSFAWQTINLTSTYITNDADDMMFYANITNTTNIKFERGGATSAISGHFRWVVVEWNKTKISSFQKGATTLVGNEDPATPKTQAVNITKNNSFLLFQCIGIGASAVTNQAATSGAIKNDSLIMFYTHDTANSLGRRCLWEVIDFGPKVGVREETINYTLPDDGATTSKTDAFIKINGVTLNKSLIYAYSTASSTSTTFRYPSGAVYYNATSKNITYSRTYVTRSPTSTNAQTISWQVLELPFNYFPNVTGLSYPGDNANISTRNVTFNFTVSDKIGVLTNCSLWGNFSGSFLENSTLEFPSNSSVNTINLTLNDGEYRWTIKCFDDYGDSDIYDLNYSFTLDSVAPSITSPILNESVINQTHGVRLNVTITDAHAIASSYATITYPNLSSSNFSLTHGAGNNYYLNFNDTLQNGTYNISQITAIDSFGNSNTTINLDKTFNVTLSPPLVFNLISPSNATESKNRYPILNWSSAYDETFSNYTLLVSLFSDFSVIAQQRESFNISNTSIDLNILSVDELYYWKVLAYDIFGSMTESTDTFVYITDNTAPTVSLSSPIDNSFIISLPALFNYTPSDGRTLDTCILYSNFSGNFIPNESNQTINNGVLNTILTNVTEGVYVWNIFCNDSAGNNAFALSNKTITVDLTPPNITLLYPSDNPYFENTTNNLIFTINVTDTWTDIAYCSLIVDDVIQKTRDNIIDGVPYNFTEFTLNGNYTWRINCTDSNGFESESEKRNISVLVVDTNPPFPTLNFPNIDDFLTTNNITFNYTPEDASNITNCSLYIDDVLNSTNLTIQTFEYSYFSLENLDERKYDWKIGCTDNSSQHNFGFSGIRNFTIDMTSPQIVFNSLYPLNDSLVGMSDINFTYTPNESNLDYCKLYGNFSGVWQEIAQDLTPVNLVNNSFSQSILDGTYIWNVICFDKTGQNNFHINNQTINIDTTSPTYSNRIVSPATGSPYSKTERYEINTTWNDNFFIDTVIIENNFSGNPSNTTLLTLGGGIYSFNTTNIGVGTYYYKLYSNDSVGNLKETVSFPYEVTQAAPIINLSFNGTEGDIIINQSQTLNITTRILELDNNYLELYLDGVMINNGSSPIENITLFSNPGVYNITSRYYETIGITGNYTNGSISYLVTVTDQTQPVISIIYPQEADTVGSKSVSFRYNVSDYSTIQNCELYIDGLLNDTDVTITKDETQIFSKTISNGSHNFQIRCSDSVNNLGISQITNFTFLPAPALTVNTTLDRARYTDNYILNAIIKTYAGQSLTNSNITIDIIMGNTTSQWWNTSWKHRKQIFLTDTLGLDHTELITINLTGLSGNISNCTREIRIIKNENANLTIVQSNITSGDNSNYCVVEFNANITANTTNDTSYIAYYNNTAALTPGFNFTPVQINVQRGVINFSSGATQFANINQINPQKSFLLFSSSTSLSTPEEGMFTGNITNSTKIEFKKFAAASLGNISWQVIEHPWINVQRGSTPIGTTQSFVINITPINLSNSFIIVNGRADVALTAGRQVRALFTASFINSTKINISRGSATSAVTSDYQVVEWPGSTVIRGNTTMAAGVGQMTVNLSMPGVNKNNTFLIFSIRTTITAATNLNDFYVYGQIYNSTQLIFSKNGVVIPVNIEYFLVTIPQGTSVFEDIRTINAGTLAINANISSINMNNTFHIASWNSTGAATTVLNAYHLFNLTNQTNINIKKQGSTYISTIATYITQISLTNYSSKSIGTQEKLISRDFNATGVDGTGTYNFVWNTTNNPFGNYSLVSATNSDEFTNGEGNSHFEIIQDNTPPNVTITLQANDFNTTNDTINFSFTPIDEFSTIMNCTFNQNGNITQFNITNGNITNFTKFNLTPNYYYWNITCSDEKGNTNTTLTRLFTKLGAPTLANITYNSTDNQSMIISWSVGIGATSYDIYIKTSYDDNFSSIPNFTGITPQYWQDNATNSSIEKYYMVGARRGNLNLTGNGVAVKKQFNLTAPWEMVAFSYNMSSLNLGNFSIYKNPILISPSNAITSIYRMNGSNQMFENSDYNETGWKNNTIGSEAFTSLEYGRGYWLLLNQNATITYYGLLLNTTFNKTIYYGWNIIGSVHPTPIALREYGQNVEPPATPLTVNPAGSISYIYTFNALDPLFWPSGEHYNDFPLPNDNGWSLSNGLTSFNPNTGYYIDVSQNATWEVGK